MITESKIKRCFDDRCYNFIRFSKEARYRDALIELGAIFALSYVLDIEPPEDVRILSTKV